MPEIVQDGQTGFLVSPRDPVALAEKVGSLFRHPDQGKVLGQAGREVIKQDYSMEAMVTKTEQLYSSLWEKREIQAA